jgi:Flp pilus assembly protein TadD
LVELGQLDEAAAHYQASLQIEPKAEIYSDLGFTMAQMGRPEEARANYLKALELDPGSASAHFNLAISDAQIGAYANAESHFRQALAGRPTAETHNGLGYVIGRQGRTDDAVAEYRKAIEVDPQYTPAYNNLAQALAGQGKLEEAAQYYRLSLAEKPSAGVYNALGNVLRSLGKEAEAEEQFAKARALGSASP